jgi:hypothetical protein
MASPVVRTTGVHWPLVQGGGSLSGCSKGFGSVEKSIAVQCQKARPALQIEGGAPSLFLRDAPVEREIISRYNRPVFYPPPLPQKDVDTESNGNDRNGIN